MRALLGGVSIGIVPFRVRTAVDRYDGSSMGR